MRATPPTCRRSRAPTISVPRTCRSRRSAAASILYVTTTTTNEVYALDLKNQTISVFADRNTIDLATGLAGRAAALASPDNLAIDHDGNIYIVEDRNGGVDDDIWFAEGPEQGRRPERSRRRHRRGGRRTARSGRSSPASTSIPPTSAGPGSTSSIRTAATTGRSKSRSRSGRMGRHALGGSVGGVPKFLQRCIAAEIAPLQTACSLSTCTWVYHGVEGDLRRSDDAEDQRHCLRS